ncbi:hypothetical protein Acr_29g0012330 [Actinidia rufa]|uniref:Uncharacterized protein n=1 Tax=Actinidia rufa TaxID=165716 RepID=A0A7J0HGB3_9ERIC|nr:hypothetical protein Acr_29g0012330 [Actinidia rufa]
MSKKTLSLSQLYATSSLPLSNRHHQFGPFIGAVLSKSSTVETSLSSFAASGLLRVPPVPPPSTLPSAPEHFSTDSSDGENGQRW